SPYLVTEKGYRRMQREGFLQPYLYYSKENGRFETSVESSTIEPVLDSPQVQDGDTNQYLQNAQARRLAHKYRPQRRVPARTGPTILTQVPAFPLEQEMLPIPNPTVRSLAFPVRIYKNSTARPPVGPQETDQDISIPGRHSDSSDDQGRSQGTHSLGSGTTKPTRISHQGCQVDIRAYPKYRPPRIHHKHRQNDIVCPEDESPRLTQGSTEDHQSRYGSTTTASSVYWKGHSHDNGGLPSSFEDTQSDTGPECSSGEEMQLDRPSGSGFVGDRESRMVEVTSIRMERTGLPASEDGHRCIHRCIGGSLGN
ncbi:hypothetical protein BGZ79_005447, partial [Entomortierella chlamydospora]